MKKKILIGLFSCLIFLLSSYICVLYHPDISKNLFGWNVYESVVRKDQFISYIPYYYSFFSVVVVGGCLLFGKAKEIHERRYWVTVVIGLPVLLIYGGFLLGFFSVEASLGQEDTVTPALKKLAQSQGIDEKEMILTGLTLHVKNIPRQRPVTFVATIRNKKTEQDDRYQYPTKFSVTKWESVSSGQSETAAKDLKLADIQLARLPGIIQDVNKRQKSLAKYHRGISIVELDTKNSYWRIGVQNVFGEVEYTYVYSVDGEYIIRFV